MAPAAGNNGGEATQNTVFLATSLDTRLVTTVSNSDTVSDFKKRITLEHRQCFPAIGDIKIHCLKVKRRGNFYHLSDSMLVKSAFGTTKRNWFLSVDASNLEQDIGIQHLDLHKARDQLVLPWVTDSRSIDRHDNHGSPSNHPKIVPFVNQNVPKVDQLTSGDSCKDVLKNIEEDRSSNDKLLAVNKEINAKKRTRDVSNKNLLKDPSGSGPTVKKKRKTKKVKASEENIVLTYDNDKVNEKGVSINDENSLEHKSKNKDFIDENTRINNGDKGENCSALDQVATCVPSGVEDVGKEAYAGKKTDASKTVADVAMVVEQNTQQEMPLGKENELVEKAVTGNDIPSSSMSSKRSTKHKVAEKESSSTSFIKKLHKKNKDAINSSQQDVGSNGLESAGDQIDKHRKDMEFSLKHGSEVKLPERRRKVKKSAAKSKNESLMKHADDNLLCDFSSTVLAQVSVEKIIDEKFEVLEKMLVDDSKKGDEMIVKEVEISEPNESRINQVNLENMDEKSRKELKDNVGSRKKKKDVEKHTNDAATVLHSERKESMDFLMENEVNISKTDKNISQVNAEVVIDNLEKPNEKMDEKKKKKKKTKKSAARNENESITKHANDDVSMPTAVSHRKDEGLVVKAKKNNRSSVTGPQDLLSKHQSTEVELESKKSQSIDHHCLPEETSKNVTVSEVSKVNNEVVISKDGSNEINFMDHFAPGHQLNKTASIDNGKDTKKPKKKTEDDSQKFVSKFENNTDVVKDLNTTNIDQIKTPKTTKKIDAKKVHGAPSAESSSSSKSLDRSFRNKKSNKQQSVVGQTHFKTLKKKGPVMNNLQKVKSLLNTPGTIFGDDDDVSDGSSGDNNATVNSDSSTRTPSRKSTSSSSGESASSIKSRRNGSRAMKRKEGGGKNSINSQSKLKNISMADLLRSSSRFKKAKFSASQQMDDFESQPVDFVPDSQPMAKR